MSKILVVDDSRTSRKILKGILESKGYEIVGEASNGEEGVKMFQECKPDVVTLDITMPVMDGIEALEKIKAIDPDARVIMVTAAGQKGNVMQALKLGAFEFVSKPFEEDVIATIMEKACAK